METHATVLDKKIGTEAGSWFKTPNAMDMRRMRRASGFAHVPAPG